MSCNVTYKSGMPPYIINGDGLNINHSHALYQTQDILNMKMGELADVIAKLTAEIMILERATCELPRNDKQPFYIAAKEIGEDVSILTLAKARLQAILISEEHFYQKRQ